MQFAEHLSRFYTKDVFWNGSYFIASCGGVTISTLKQSIEAQDSPEIGEQRGHEGFPHKAIANPKGNSSSTPLPR